jgi:hypothetical protein
MGPTPTQAQMPFTQGFALCCFALSYAGSKQPELSHTSNLASMILLSELIPTSSSALSGDSPSRRFHHNPLPLLCSCRCTTCPLHSGSQPWPSRIPRRSSICPPSPFEPLRCFRNSAPPAHNVSQDWQEQRRLRYVRWCSLYRPSQGFGPAVRWEVCPSDS